jgi:hypothetical protein
MISTDGLNTFLESKFMNRVILFALGLMALANSSVRAADPPALPPFELGLLAGDHREVLMIRPSEFMSLELFADDEARETIKGSMTGLIELFSGTVDEKVMPKIEEIEQLVTNAEIGLDIDEEGTAGSSVGGVSSGVIRTKKAFDWNSMVQTTFKQATKSKVDAGTFWTLSFKMGNDDFKYNILIPDDRTICFGLEADMQKLLEQLAQKKSPAKIEPWLHGCSLAFVLNKPAMEAVKTPKKVKQKDIKALVAILKPTKSLTAGLLLGKETKLRIVGELNPNTPLKAIERSINTFTSMVSKQEETPKEVSELLKNVKTKVENQRYNLEFDIPSSFWKLEINHKAHPVTCGQ